MYKCFCIRMLSLNEYMHMVLRIFIFEKKIEQAMGETEHACHKKTSIFFKMWNIYF